MKKIINIKLIILFILILGACKNSKILSNQTPIVKIGEKYLYFEEIQEFLPEGISSEDSIIKVNNYIDLWIKKELMLQAAEKNLSDEYDDIQTKVEDYKNSLLIHKYSQKILEQKLDTNIENSEIEQYYNQNIADFRLTKSAIKGVYIKILKSDKQLSNVISWCKSSNPNDSLKLAEYCSRKATKYDDFKGSWIYFNSIISDFSYDIDDPESFLQKRNFIETEDETFYYILKITDYLLTNEQAPINFAKDNIKTIILNKRERLLIDEVENNVYEKAMNDGKIEYLNQ